MSADSELDDKVELVMLRVDSELVDFDIEVKVGLVDSELVDNVELLVEVEDLDPLDELLVVSVNEIILSDVDEVWELEVVTDVDSVLAIELTLDIDVLVDSLEDLLDCVLVVLLADEPVVRSVDLDVLVDSLALVDDELVMVLLVDEDSNVLSGLPLCVVEDIWVKESVLDVDMIDVRLVPVDSEIVVSEEAS